VSSHLEDIQKDICSKEFLAFKDCVQKHVRLYICVTEILDEETMVNKKEAGSR
jgi:hypothetical protein